MVDVWFRFKDSRIEVDEEVGNVEVCIEAAYIPTGGMEKTAPLNVVVLFGAAQGQ